MSIYAGSHSLQEHRVGCPPIACLDEHQQDSRGTFTIILQGQHFTRMETADAAAQGPPTRYIARRAEILGSYRIGETWYHNDWKTPIGTFGTASHLRTRNGEARQWRSGSTSACLPR